VASAWTSPAFFNTITGTIGGRVFNRDGDITEFTVTPPSGPVETITVEPPNPGASAAINQYVGETATVTYHTSGGNNIYDGIADL
jgi:hypothetical protein